MSRIAADILPNNRAMRAISKPFGFQPHRWLDELVRAVLEVRMYSAKLAKDT